MNNVAWKHHLLDPNVAASAQNGRSMHAQDFVLVKTPADWRHNHADVGAKSAHPGISDDLPLALQAGARAAGMT